MGGKLQPGSLYDRIRQAVRRLGECSNQQIISEVGDTITAAAAAAAGQKEAQSSRKRRVQEKAYTPHELVHIGRRRIISNAVHSLVQNGFIERGDNRLYKLTRKAVVRSLSETILEILFHLGDRSIDQLLPLVDDKISIKSALDAYQCWHRCYTKRRGGIANPRPATWERMIEYGKRRCLSYSLCGMKARGKVRRVGTGVYGLPAPKLFESHQEKVG